MRSTLPRRAPRRLDGDSAVSSVLGAVFVFAIIAAALVYVNGYRVPDKGADWERAQARAIDRDMDRLAVATVTAAATRAPAAVALALAPEAPQPSVLRGVLLDPSAPATTLAFAPDAAALRVSHVVPGAGRVYDVGNATAREPVGSLSTLTAGRYVPALSHAVEAGASLRGAEGAFVVAEAPGWSWRASSTGTSTLALTIPALEGDAVNLTDSRDHGVALTPASGRAVGGARAAASEVRVEVASPHASAWGAFLNATFAPAAATVDRAAGTATIDVPAPGAAGIALDLEFSRIVVALRS